MDLVKKIKNNKLFLIGLTLTFLWLAMFCVLSGLNPLGILDGRFDTFHKLDLNAKGDFLAGLFAPVAFLWLIIGSFQQQQEITNQLKEMQLQREETKQMVKAQNEQAKSIEANTNHAAMQTFLILEKSLNEGLKWNLKNFLMNYHYSLQTENLVEKKDNLFLIINAVRISLNGKTQQEIQNSRNDVIQITEKHIDFYQTYKNKKIVSSAINSYFQTFEMLIAEAEKIDTLLNEYYYNKFIDDKADELSNTALRKMLYPPDKAKKHYKFEYFHKNSPAGELYNLFKDIIAEVEEHNKAVEEHNKATATT